MQNLRYTDIKDKLEYAVITPHPLRDCYCLHSPFLTIPPYIGTMEECKAHKNFLESKVLRLISQLSNIDKDRLINDMNRLNKLIYKQ